MSDKYPTCITVFCDVCGLEHTGDYLVSDACDSTTRLGYARTHMRTLGWRCDEQGDFCPEHAGTSGDAGPSTRSLVIVDTETSGLRDFDVAVEIAWHDLNTGERGTFIPAHDPEWVIDFGQPEALEINGYRERILGKPQDDGTELARLHQALHGQTLGGSNPSFDADHLAALFFASDLAPQPFHHRLWDLSAYAAGVLGLDELPGLARVCELLYVPPGDHTAEGDVTATGTCFRILQGIAAERAA